MTISSDYTGRKRGTINLSVDVFLYLSVPACVYQTAPSPVCLSHSMDLPASLPACLYTCQSVCPSVCLALCVCLPACVPACMPVSLSVCLCHAICLSASLPACVYACQFVCVTVSPCFRLAGWLLSPCLSVCQRVRVFASQPVCLCHAATVCMPAYEPQRKYHKYVIIITESSYYLSPPW